MLVIVTNITKVTKVVDVTKDIEVEEENVLAKPINIELVKKL